MKNKITILLCSMFLMQTGFAQNANNKVDRTIQKVDHAVNKGKAIIEVFQPYLLKARELYAQARQLVKDTKASAKAAKNNPGNNGTNEMPAYQNTTSNTGVVNDANNTPAATPPASYPPSNENAGGNTYAPAVAASDPSAQYGVYNNYTPQQYLPINNQASVNADGSGNWGNQNSGLYGNCLDVLTGTVVSMGEAEDNPAAVDLMFFAPADGQNTYVLMTPSFAKNNATATYMTVHASDGITKWRDVTESEVALTKLTIGQFERIQNNSQISGAVKNAVNYSGWYTSVGTKLEGQVFAVKVEQENRTVYALVAVIKHFGTSGSNGYLKIKVKSQGIDNNADGMVDPNSYIR
jgi:hypothetical protein